MVSSPAPSTSKLLRTPHFATFSWPGMRICASNTPKLKVEDPTSEINPVEQFDM